MHFLVSCSFVRFHFRKVEETSWIIHEILSGSDDNTAYIIFIFKLKQLPSYTALADFFVSISALSLSLSSHLFFPAQKCELTLKLSPHFLPLSISTFSVVLVIPFPGSIHHFYIDDPDFGPSFSPGLDYSPLPALHPLPFPAERN